MRRDADGDQEIAGGMAGRGFALPFQADLLTGDNARRNLDIELLAGGQPDPLLAALDRFFQRHRHGDAEIEIGPKRALVERSRPAPRAPAEHPLQNVCEAAAPRKAAAGPAAGAEAEGLNPAARRWAATPRPRIAARKTLEARLAFGVDLAAVELLALVLVADDLIGGVY